MREKILVTGSAGFIGYHLCNRLIKENFEVIGLDNLNDYYDVSLKESRNQILKELSIEDLKSLQEDIKKELDRRTIKIVDKTE